MSTVPIPCLQQNVPYLHLQVFLLQPLYMDKYTSLNDRNVLKWSQQKQKLTTSDLALSEIQLVAKLQLLTSNYFAMGLAINFHSCYKAFFTFDINLDLVEYLKLHDLPFHILPNNDLRLKRNYTESKFIQWNIIVSEYKFV